MVGRFEVLAGIMNCSMMEPGEESAIFPGFGGVTRKMSASIVGRMALSCLMLFYCMKKERVVFKITIERKILNC
ncbi:hypothetical protein AZH53_00585 [Methanomicrobiaceae archaeon CYW5]|uniref:hypothetical protein n=1 Tax=Methanovulcanius yangii TaxID=1789227 RepID=UPI0029CA8A75|nr:hypothetical protein [Methanovulcanius yangii]MBT8506926.1 hypothetical protein [Methanovulcanius yangii]